MRRLYGVTLIAILLLVLFTRVGANLPVFAQALPEETRILLEKSLSLVEIDREVERISHLKDETEDSIQQSEAQLTEQEIAIAVQRERAGRVLRSYYMGYNDFWLSSFLSADSLSELIRVWDVMDLLIESDEQTMEQYEKEYKKLSKGYAQLQRDKSDLIVVQNQLLAQRERIISLQNELDTALASSGDEQMLLRLMEELQAYWKNVGLYEVKKHFKALAGAMNNLPDFIKETPGIIQSSGLKTKLTLSDAQLNEFLRSEDQRFDDFSFSFDDGLLTMEGDTGSMSVKIQGRYTIEEEPENAIRFHVDALYFNGFALPDTTRAELEREFDLGFYPQKLIKFVVAESVTLDKGNLIVQLRIGN